MHPAPRSDTWAQTKPLRKLRRRDYGLRRVLVVDDSPEKHTRNYANLVAVQAFEGDPADDELPRLARYLEQLAPEPDHRRVEKRRWRRRCGQRRRPFP
nr:NIF family HAD-type phosphatase [Tahibacter harae]